LLFLAAIGYQVFINNKPPEEAVKVVETTIKQNVDSLPSNRTEKQKVEYLLLNTYCSVNSGGASCMNYHSFLISDINRMNEIITVTGLFKSADQTDEFRAELKDILGDYSVQRICAGGGGVQMWVTICPQTKSGCSD
jgi:hypothetical protein